MIRFHITKPAQEFYVSDTGPEPQIAFSFPDHSLTVFQECKTDPTISFINRPLQTGYRRNGVHELVLGPKLSIGDLGLPHIPSETEF